MTFARRAAAAAALLGITLVPTSAGAAGGSSNPVPTQDGKNATFGAAPASAKKVDGRQHFVFNTTPGGQITDHLAVLNVSRKPLKLRVYTVDAVPALNGAVSFPAADAKRTQAGAWMAVGTPGGRGVVTVRPRMTTILPLHVHIPADASPGDHLGAAVVSLVGKVQGGQFGHGGAQKLNFEQRIAIQAQFRVTGPLRPVMAIEHLQASYDGPTDPFATGRATVSYTVHNGGNVVLGGPQTVTVSGIFGQSVTVHAAAVPGLLPGASYPVTVRLPGVYPQLLMSAKVTVQEEGLTGQITPGLHAVSAEVHFWAIPWVIVLVILLLLAFAWLLWRRRRRRKAQAAASPGRHRQDVVKQGASI